MSAKLIIGYRTPYNRCFSWELHKIGALDNFVCILPISLSLSLCFWVSGLIFFSLQKTKCMSEILYVVNLMQ